MDKITKINALVSEKMNFSTLGIRSELKDYELAYWLNLYFDIKLIARGDATDFQIGRDIYEYNVFDGLDHKGEGLCMVTNLSSGVKEKINLGLNLFESTPEKHLLPSLKHWDCFLMAENAEFAIDLETALKRNPKITAASYFEAHTQLTQPETHLLYEIKNN